jgi:hypothetical protein
MLRLHPWRIVVAADSHADDIRPPQPFERLGHKGAVAIGWRLVVEEIADMGEDARMVRDGIIYGGGEGATQALAALLAALRCQARETRREMVIAGDDDANRW